MKAKIILITLLIIVILTGCFKDNGNYTYSDRFEISVKGLEREYNKITMVDSFIFTPQITPENRNYTYFWGIYNAFAQGYIPTMDTLCHTKDLTCQINLSTGTYTLVFGVKDVKTSYTHIERINVNVETELTTGWYLLKDEEDYTDLDVFTSNRKIENIIAQANRGKKLLGCAQTMMYIPYDYINWDTESNTYKQEIVMITLTNKDAAVIRVEDGKITRSFEDMFYFPPQTKSPTDVFLGNNAIYLVNDNKIHSIDKSGENTGRFGEPIMDHYQFSSNRVSTDFTTPILWDELSSSFKSVNSYDAKLISFFDNPEKGLPPMNHLNAELLFMGAQGNWDLKAYCLFKQRGKEVYELRELDAGYLSSFENNTLNHTILPSSLLMPKADHWATHLDLNIIYFIKDQQIYSCNLDANFTETPLLSPLPATEEVTFMRHLRFSGKLMNFNYLVIATHVQRKYKLYLYPIEGGNLQTPSQILEGNGRVVKAIYVNNGSNSEILM